jgi:hypothetical protein
MKVLKLWSALFHEFFGQRCEQDRHSVQVADNLALHRKHFELIFEHSTDLVPSLTTFRP